MASLIIPFSSKSGVCILAGYSIYGEEWSLDIAIEDEEYKHFEMTADTSITSLIWKEDISSFAGGTARIRAKYDNTPTARLYNNKSVWLDSTGTGWLGYTSTVGFVITYRVINLRPATNTNTPGSAMYDFDLRIRSCLPSIAGP